MTIPDKYIAALEARHGDIPKWLLGLARAEFDVENRRIAEAALRSGKLKDAAFAAAVADQVRQMESK